MSRRAQRSASFMEWVEMKRVTLSWRGSRNRMRQKAPRATGSALEVGPPRISVSGVWIMATARSVWREKRCDR